MERISRLIQVEHVEQADNEEKKFTDERRDNAQSEWKSNRDLLREAVESRLNPGESMYLRGLKRQQRRVEKLDELRRQKNEKLVQSCTFRPNINQKSERGQNESDLPIEDRLILFNQDKQSKITRMKNIVEELANLECTFQPTINQ